MNNGDMPASPCRYLDDASFVHLDAPGMTKREYFAGLAMQALVSDNVNAQKYGYKVTPQQTARDAVEQADALLAELEESDEH